MHYFQIKKKKTQYNNEIKSLTIVSAVGMAPKYKVVSLACPRKQDYWGGHQNKTQNSCAYFCQCSRFKGFPDIPFI